MHCKQILHEAFEKMDRNAYATPGKALSQLNWTLTNCEEAPSSSYNDCGAHEPHRVSAKKRGRDWYVEHEYISRQLVTTMNAEQAQQSQENHPFSSIFPTLSFSPAADPAMAGPAKSWSSDDTAEFSTFELQSSERVPSKRFRKYCAKNPYAAQAAAASLLAGAAWLEAVQALAAVKAVESNHVTVRLAEASALDYSTANKQRP